MDGGTLPSVTRSPCGAPCDGWEASFRVVHRVMDGTPPSAWSIVPWLVGGDLHSFALRSITDTLNNILTCALCT